MIGEHAHPRFQGESGVSQVDIIRWWEQRRLGYNLYVGFAGFVAWWLVLVAGGAAVKPGEDFAEPLAMFSGPGLSVILANVGYTFGWLPDVALYRGSPGKRLFRSGFMFSLVLTALPGIWAVVALLITVHTGRKLD